MPLIVEGVLRREGFVRRGFVDVYITVSSRYLSRQYDIPSFTATYAEGEVLAVSRVYGKPFKGEEEAFKRHVVGAKSRFYVVPGYLVPHDSLYLSEELWGSLRDCGAFPGEHRIRVKLYKLIIGGKELDLYPYVEVVAEG